MIYEEKCGRTMAKYFRFPEGKYSEEALNSLIKSMISKVPNPVVEANYCIENDKLIK